MTEQIQNQQVKSSRSKVGTILAVIIALLCFIYMANPTAGIVEILPDNLPVIGNVDEGLIMILLLGCLKYLGIDIPLTKSTPKP
ncbi:MAG: DUF1232 domain-containing protein [Pirellulales bacterium]|nr:DUF1232 domain-containing protein [Pirellulales bacterium]